MAAYAALSSLSEATELLQKSILQKATDDEDGVHRTSSRNLLLQQLEIEIESLLENTNFLRSVLEKSPTHPFEALMKDAAEQAQVIIEQFVLDHLHPEWTVDNDLILESLSHQLQRIHEDLICSMVDKIKNNISESDEESVGILYSFSLGENTVTSADTAVVTDDVRERLLGLFFDETSTELRVVSIVGMGGIGKTSLASWCYGYIMFSDYSYQVFGLVKVSRDFNARDILVSLMESIQPYVSKPKQRDESIENYVRKSLEGRRFFILLDNVWSPEALRIFMRTIPDDGNRSVILITTRHEEVAVEANPNKPMHTVMMRLRTPDESLDLLQAKVFGDQGCPPDELRPLLPSIAMVCDGLPLALALVAGILRSSNRSLHEYKYILVKLSVEYNSRHEMVDAILSLSYIHLPHCLRSCLLYMGAFPDDRQICLGRLTKQLSAQCCMHKSTIHEVQQCLEYLVDRSLLSVETWKLDLRVGAVWIHDMVRDFCLKKAREEKFLHCVTDDDSDHDLTGSKIKVSYNLDSLKRICNSDDSDYDTHSIMCFGNGWTRSRSLVSVGRFRLLKSLDLANVEIESFPNEILTLFLLRLLALGHVPELPESISNLKYLETLIVNDAKGASLSVISSMVTLPCILCVPFEIWKLSQLRHIISFCCGALPSANKEENPPLENLETLSAVMNLDCSEDLIEMIPNVKKLGIFYFGVERATHSIENIERLSRLEKLKVWVMVPFSAPQNLNLGFPTTLRRLTLRGLRLSHRDLLVIGRLPDLQVLKLRRDDFEGDEWRMTTAHQVFKKLEYLVLEELGLRSWFPDSDNGFVFPMLQMLIIRTCNKLNEIEKVVRNSPSIDGIVIRRCNKSLVESAKRISQSNKNIRVFIR